MIAQQPFLKDFEDFVLIVGVISSKTQSALRAAKSSGNPEAILRAGGHDLDSLLRMFEQSVLKLMGERRKPNESMLDFFARISVLSEVEILSMMTNTKRSLKNNAQ
jgi:hypothetical protein